MIETLQDCKTFIDNSDGDWIVHAVPLKEDVHPSDNKLSILFIYVIQSKKIYYYAVSHPDSSPTVSFNQFLDECILSRNNKKWTIDKKSFLQLLSIPNLYDINLCSFLKKNVITDFQEFDTATHGLIRRNSKNISCINRVIPIMKHMEAFEDMCDSLVKLIYEFDKPALLVNNIIIESLAKMESNGIFVDSSKFQTHFSSIPNDQNLVYSQYNIYTSTGRPSNRFGGINYAALNVKDGSRECFISRYGEDGAIVVLDYTAFHPRIICMLTKYNVPIDTNIYEYLARLYFQKDNIDETDVADAKKLTFKQLYGGVDEKYAHIKYLSNLKSYIDEQWSFFEKNGYVLTPVFKRKITDKHILDPNPTKVFNYILQAVEGEFAIPKLKEIQRYLVGKKTKDILYTYDSIIFDFHKEDGIDVIKEIRRIMSFDNRFSIKVYMGRSYHAIKQIYL